VSQCGQSRTERGGVRYIQDAHFFGIGDTLLTIKELHQEEICKTSETQNLQFADYVFLTYFSIVEYTYKLRHLLSQLIHKLIIQFIIEWVYISVHCSTPVIFI